LLRHNLSVAPDRFAVGIDLLHHLVAVAKPAAAFPFSTLPRKPRWVFIARSFRNKAFIVPFRPT
jgi:hypothetical protein